MAVKIRLKRMGKIRQPYYRIVVADSRTKRDGRVIEEIGKYHPKEDPSFIEVDSERAQYWLGVGAQPSEPVTAILKVTGDWQKFKGEAAPAPMKVAEPKRDKAEIFNEALKDSQTSRRPRPSPPRRPPPRRPHRPRRALPSAERGSPADEAARSRTPSPRSSGRGRSGRRRGRRRCRARRAAATEAEAPARHGRGAAADEADDDQGREA